MTDAGARVTAVRAGRALWWVAIGLAILGIAYGAFVSITSPTAYGGGEASTRVFTTIWIVLRCVCALSIAFGIALLAVPRIRHAHLGTELVVSGLVIPALYALAFKLFAVQT